MEALQVSCVFTEFATLRNVLYLIPSFLGFEGGSAEISRLNSPRSILKSSRPVIAHGHVASCEEGSVGSNARPACAP